jgi:GT2 family glycosyltransferase
MIKLEYSVVIRTLGRAGEKYQMTLNSLDLQSIPPKEIIVYIAKGYEKPKETIGKERYVVVKKGMVAQRALRYDEVSTEWCLFLDDDVYLPKDGVEKLYNALIENHADVVSPDVFSNSGRSFMTKVKMAFLGKSIPHRDDGRWAYKVLRNGGYSYNIHPVKNVYESQTNAGPCLFCKKRTFLNINFENEQWLDELSYAQCDDQVMYYKMWKHGYKILTLFHSGIIHLDAGSTQKTSSLKLQKVLYSDFYSKYVYWHRFIYLPERNKFLKLWDILNINYTIYIQIVMSYLNRNKRRFSILQAIHDAKMYIRSTDYKNLPKI